MLSIFSFAFPKLSKYLSVFILASIISCGGGGSGDSQKTSITPPDASTTTLTTISWNPPTQNTDDSQLTDLAGFNIYYGESQSTLDTQIVIEDPSAYAKVIENLQTGKTYYFAMTAVNSLGIESDLSAVVSKSFD